MPTITTKASRLRPLPAGGEFAVENALALMREARKWLRRADCPKSLARLESTIKSTEGAVRHAQRRAMRNS